MATKETLIKFITDDILMGQSQATITPETSLIESGILDSLSLIRLINFVEDNFNVTLEDEDVISDNFETVNVLSTLIESK
jgi:acyl carrier protein